MQKPDLMLSVAHGGNLGDAVRRYGIAREDWIDLSTGINPNGYPAPRIDAETWVRLPADDDDLEEVAARCYGAPRALAMAGTQAAIRMLPQVLPAGAIGIGLLTYGEYAPAFERAGFPVARFVTAALADMRAQASFVLEPGQRLPASIRHLVLVNPNNPGTERFAPDVVMQWHRQLAARGGTLIVDEAFADAVPGLSVASQCEQESLIVLRSIGKFFGLAGARVGFVLAGENVDHALRQRRGPWTVAGPSRAAARAALVDTAWQEETRARLGVASARLVGLLRECGLHAHPTPLFAWVRETQAAEWQDCLARQGVWIRRFDDVPGMRFGLPANERAWARLQMALECARSEIGGR